MRFYWLALVVLLVPTTARAELYGCTLTGAAGGRAFEQRCDRLERCTTGATCSDGSPCDPLSHVCLPECSTIIGCDTNEDCASLRASGVCQPFAADAGLDEAGLCTAPGEPVQYCNGAADLQLERFLSCHTLPFSDTLTPSWFDGDCDQDGCPNASDDAPCSGGGACGRPSASVPVCDRRLIEVGPERCVFPSEAPSCATAHDCKTPADCPPGFGCDGSCEPLECTALYSCRALGDCPDDTALGLPILCLPSVLLDPGLGRGDGFCLFASFDVTIECAALSDARSCFFRDGAFSNDFYQGDCDLDGCPNGLDPNPCAAGTERCRAEGFSPACDTPIPPARLDGGRFDAAIPDSGVGFDAAGFDGGVSERVTFGGGGGCVCSAGGGRAPSPSLLLLVAILLSLPSRRARVTLLQKLAAERAWPSARRRAPSAVILLRLLRNLALAPLFPLWWGARFWWRPRERWIRVRLSPRLIEFARPEPWYARLVPRPNLVKPTSLGALRELAEQVQKAPKVRGVLFEMPSLMAGWVACRALRGLMLELKASGKEVVVYLPSGGGNRELFVASAASRVLASPSAPLAPLGLAASRRQLKGLLDRFGLEVEVYRRAEYKTAAEGVSSFAMSEPQREQTTALLATYERALIDALKERPGLDEAAVRALFDRGLLSGQDAIDAMLIDELAYDDEVAAKVTGDPDKKLAAAPAWLAHRLSRFFVRVLRRPYVAVIPVHGTISDAGQGPGAAKDAVVSAIRRAAKDPRALGVVLHVDSPGGSALASDLIHREVMRLKEKKPVVACFGEVAASGGYYVSAGASRSSPIR